MPRPLVCSGGHEREDVDAAARFGSERHDLAGDGHRRTPENAACSVLRGRATTHSLGRRLWPDLPRPRMAGFEVSTEVVLAVLDEHPFLFTGEAGVPALNRAIPPELARR